MEIINYTGKEYTKCKMQEAIFNGVEFPCEVKHVYLEDEGIEYFIQHGVMSIPTLYLKDKKEIKLNGNYTKKQIEDALIYIKG